MSEENEDRNSEVELLPEQGALPMLWRVKKSADGSIYGPVDVNTLKEWANSAQIAPQDMIDLSDDNWRNAPDIDFLDMLWLVNLPGDDVYGPTTLGTLREFVQESLISEKTVATHAKTNQSLPIGALFAAVEFEKRRAQRRPPKESKSMKSTASLAVDMAKDQRIRQLEEDLKELKHEYEMLTHKYRQLSLQTDEGGRTATARKSE
jgi:ribosomal protein L19E